MWHLAQLVMHPALILLGVFCLFTGLLLHTDEEGKIQNWFEDFWVRVDDYQQLVLSRHTAFMVQVAKFETKLLDSLFGSELWSLRAIVVSVCCSVASFGLGMLIIGHASGEEAKIWCLLLVGLIVLVVVFIRTRSPFARGIIVGILLLADLLFVLVPIPDLVLVAGGVLSDVAFIALTRRIVRWAGEMRSTFEVLGAVVFTLVLACVLLSPAFGLSSSLSNFFSNSSILAGVSALIALISLSNLFDAMLALLFVFLALILLLHRALWPLLNRTVFRIQEAGIKGRRAILVTIGIALLGLPELIKRVMEKVAG
jgi:hypothetical protein